MAHLDDLKARFLVDEPPPTLPVRRRVVGIPSPRPTAPKPGRQLLTWIIEEADEQQQLGQRRASVPITKRDVQHLQYLLQWILAVERERTEVG
jgi:cytochrome oxidase assembly protein ShyY1